MAKKKEKMLKITQVRSRIGYKPDAKRTLDALGLRRLNQTVVQKDNPAIRGMIKKIEFMLKVEEVG
ncbi:MAG: 50S ribosomal protein L30 [Candidatus Neomarinimicrobiota bacterium]|nr:MAG: 50S ribosomal protein L30 [Candidatus Neomarinimicrobiota bacterium]